MPFVVRTRTQPGVTGLDPTIYILEDGQGNRAEVWPALGFNCFLWQAPFAGQTLDLLYADPALFSNGRPTRSGIPILFPFPNRIRAGIMSWDGQEYHLPANDSPPRNAIHGFACRHPWRVTGQGADSESAWLTGTFRGSLDAPESVSLWPADYQLAVTCRLGAGWLRVEADVTNPDRKPLPFGLGYHPYFRLPFAPGGKAEDCLVKVPARSYWVLQDSLPTGETKPVDDTRNLNELRRFGDLQVDDVLTDLPARIEPGTELDLCSTLQDPSGAELRILCSPVFREMVIFTPPHRQAFCVEPYTCPTDAINLQARGIDAGWLVVGPGERWRSVVELRVDGQ
jgi:aldose 1-epimerase